MNKLKKQIADLRTNTPKRVQWILLAAAFMVVLILMTLLLGRNDDNADLVNVNDDVRTQVEIEPAGPINWEQVVVGTEKNTEFTLTTNLPIKILDVVVNPEIDGLTHTGTCETMVEINDSTPCTIDVKYAPTLPMDVKQTTIQIEWQRTDVSDTISDVIDIDLTVGAQAPVIQEPELPPVEEPDEIEIIEPEPEPIFFDDEPIADPIDDIQPILTPEPIAPEPVRPITQGAESCSDFAFPGYNTAGQQSGWIKPSGGAYYFHPFSDRNCDSPTGVYNPDTGIIFDINNRGKKIGTDAEHIGYTEIMGGTIPQLSNTDVLATKTINRARELTTEDIDALRENERVFAGVGWLLEESQDGQPSRQFSNQGVGGIRRRLDGPKTYLGSGSVVLPTQPYDRQFILRQYKPIPATIVSDIRADAEELKANPIPVRATVDRNVYSDAGRNVIIPTGTLMLGYIDGKLPGPYTTIGRMGIKWYQFILPNGMEYNFNDANAPYSADSQGRSGVPGRGSSDYLEQFFMPMLTAIVPAAVNMIAPISDAFVNQIDLDNNTVVQSGTVRSSELAKNEIITAWNQVAQRLLVDMMDNTVPPFTIPAGTRITVYSPHDLVASCGETGGGKKCSLGYADSKPVDKVDLRYEGWRADYTKGLGYKDDGSQLGQVRSFAVANCCNANGTPNREDEVCKIYDYATLAFYCQSSQYVAINNARQDAIYANQKEQFTGGAGESKYEIENKPGVSGNNSVFGNTKYNEEVLGLKYNEDGTIQNPYEKQPSSSNTGIGETVAGSADVVTCQDGSAPDTNGCCPGEVYTDMGPDLGFNCCPAGDPNGDCFPPMF